MKKILLSTVAILSLTSGSANAFTSANNIDTTTPEELGICEIARYVESSTQEAFLYITGGFPNYFTMPNGSYWSKGTFTPYQIITKNEIAFCLQTDASNVTLISADGADAQSTWAEDTYMGFTYKLSQNTDHQTAGTYEVSLTGSTQQPSDTTPPTVLLSALSGPTNGTYTTQITLSEDSTDFDASDLTLINATAVLTGAGTDYTAILTPIADGQISINVAATKFTDAAGNPNTPGTAVMALVDQNGPVITAQPSSSYTTDGGSATKLINLSTLGTATDSLDGQVPVLYKIGTTTISNNYAFPVGTTTVTMNAIDKSGNAAEQVSVTVEVSDTEPPYLTSTVNNIFTPTDPQKSTSTVDLRSYISVTDNVDETVTLTYFVENTKITGSTYDFPIGSTQVKITASDSQENETGLFIYVIVTDEESPAITGPANVNVNSDPQKTTAIFDVTSIGAVSDNADTTLDIVYRLNQTILTGPNTFPVGVSTITMDAVDSSNNTAIQKSFTVTVLDATPPVITAPANVSLQTEVNKNTASLDVTNLGQAGDGIDGAVPITYKIGSTVLSESYTFPVGVTTVTMDAVDSANNAAIQASFTVTVSDAGAPTLTAPANIAATTDAGQSTTLLDVTTLGSGTDNVDTTLNITHKVGSTVLSGAYMFPVGTTIVTMDAIDSANNAATQASFTVTIADEEAPTLQVPQTINTNTADDAATATMDVTRFGSASDAVDGSLPVAYTLGGTPLTGIYDFPVGITVVTMTATDAAKNTTQATFSVRVFDSAMPIITAPQNLSITTDNGQAVATSNVTTLGSAVDNVDGALPITYKVGSTVLSGDYNFPVGVTTVTMDAVDSANNAAVQASFTVTVSDAGAPIITAPENLSAFTNENKTTATLNVTTLGSATDFVDGPLPVTYKINGNIITGDFVFPVGITKVTMDATDKAGNAATQTSFTVTIFDAGLPTLTAPANVALTTDAGQSTAMFDVTTLGTASDQIDGTLPITYKVGSTVLSGAYAFPVGVTTVTMDATDKAGNAATKASFTVTVSDVAAPTITAPANLALTTDASQSTALFNVTTLGSATDAVDGTLDITYTIDQTVITEAYAFPIGVTTVQMNAVDTANNAAVEVSFTVTVSDAGAPVITAPKNIILTTDAGVNTASVDVTQYGSATDTVDGPVPVIYTIGSTVLTGPYAFTVGVTTITMNAVDKKGNKAIETSFTITVKDVTAPLTPQAPKIVTNLNGTITVSGIAEAGSTITVTFPDGTTARVKADASGAYTLTSKTAQGNGNISVTAMDAAGNISNAVLSVYEAADDIAPEIAASVTMIINGNSSITISGQAESGGTVEIVFPDGTTKMAPVSGRTSGLPAGTTASTLSARGSASGVLAATAGSFSATSAPEQPSGMVEVTVIDAAGNRSEVLNLSFVGMPTVDAIHEEIAGYVQARAGNIINAQPDLIGLLSGTVAGAFNADVTRGLGTFELASNGKGNVWGSVTGNWSKTDGNDNNYYFGVVGTHTNISSDAILGVMVQFDKMTQENGTSKTSGNGYLVGPYFVAKMPNQPLYFEGRVLKGTSDNTVNIEGSTGQDFTTNTTLIMGKVAGELNYQSITLTPSLQGTYFKDTQEAFTDTAGRTISQQSITVKELALGLDASKEFALKDGDFVLTGGLTSIWSDTTGTGYAATLDSPYQGQRARLNIDGVYTSTNGITFTAGTYYDGLGTDNYQAWGLQAGVEKTF
jgi:hypothetical protein